MELLWNTLIVNPLLAGLRAFASPLEGMFSPGVAGGLAIILFTLAIRLVLLPLTLAQTRSQKAMMRLQPEMKEVQRKFKNDREGLARAQMALYKERGVNPAAGCLPMLVQMPILFGMYSAMLHLATVGLTLDQVQPPTIADGRVTYAATRTDEPFPTNQFVLARLQVTPAGGEPIPLDVAIDESTVSSAGIPRTVQAQGLTLIPGQSTGNPNPPNPPAGQAAFFLRPGGTALPDGTLDRNVVVTSGQPYLVEVWVNAPQERVDAAKAVVTFDPALVSVNSVTTPPLQDVPFKSSFMGLRSLGEPDLIQLNLFNVWQVGIPGVLLLLMTVTSFLVTRMTTTPTDDPQQRSMMRIMTVMPLMYLFFFLTTPAGLVVYWFTSNVFTIAQQYFTTGLGNLRGDLKRITGRDLQPPWAQSLMPLNPSPVPPSRNGRHDGAGRGNVEEGASATANSLSDRGQRLTATERRARAASARGRKRGKR